MHHKFTSHERNDFEWKNSQIFIINKISLTELQDDKNFLKVINLAFMEPAVLFLVKLIKSLVRYIAKI